MEPSSSLPFVVHVDDSDGPGDVIDALALDAFVSGLQPWARTVRLERVRADAPLIPGDHEPARVAYSPGCHVQLAKGPGWTLRSVRWSDHTATLTVTAIDAELGRSILDQASEDAVEPEPPEGDALALGFWHLGQRPYPQRASRSVAIAPWAEIRRNYSASVAEAFDHLMRLDPSDMSGRLLLIHGPPGTGKTTALRALAHAWREWCRFEYILDPERLLDLPGYLMNVALGDDDDDKRWRLLVLEDCDELVRAEAKKGAGQSLARLLNLTDGLLGQGLEVLVCITTNEALSHLHPAVVRPGRCIAQIHVGRLPRSEAAAWLGSGSGVSPEGATLAELLALRGDLAQVAHHDAPELSGPYL